MTPYEMAEVAVKALDDRPRYAGRRRCGRNN